MKINDFQGELTDISAKKAALMATAEQHVHTYKGFGLELLRQWRRGGRSAVLLYKPKYRFGHPENYLIHYLKNLSWIKVSKKHFI